MAAVRHQPRERKENTFEFSLALEIRALPSMLQYTPITTTSRNTAAGRKKPWKHAHLNLSGLNHRLFT
jgi:hypothetical protein